jgi:hypothetical protein
MISAIKTFLLVVCTIICLSISFSVRAAEAPEIIEGFGCTFLEGKGMDDLNDAVEFYQSKIKRIKSPEFHKMGSVLWIPYRGSAGVDFVWINNNVTLSEWGKATVAYDSSKEGQAADAKFFEMSTCASGLAISEVIFATEDRELADSGGVLIESFSCNLRDGQTLAATDAAIKAWRPVFASAVNGKKAASVVLRRVPLVSGRGYDVNYAAIWDNVAVYAEVNEAFAADPDSAKSNQLFGAAHKCNSALWKGRIVTAWE